MGYCVCLAEGFHLPPGTQGLVKSLARTRKKALKCSSSKEKGKGGFWAQPGWWHCHGCGCHGCLNWDVGAGTSTRETGCLGFLNTRPNGTEQDKDNASLKEKTNRFFLLRLRVHGNLLHCWVSLTQQPCKSRPWLQQCSHSKTDTVNCMMLTSLTSLKIPVLPVLGMVLIRQQWTQQERLNSVTCIETITAIRLQG